MPVATDRQPGADNISAEVTDSESVVVGKHNSQQTVNVNTANAAAALGERVARLEERWDHNSDMAPATDNSPYTLLRLEAKIDRVLERQENIIAEQADMRRRLGVVESMTQGLQKQSPTLDRIMVAVLALVMLAMLAFNLWMLP